MKGITIVAFWLLASTSPLWAFDTQSIPLGCVVIARCHQQEYRAAQRLQNHGVWSRILCVGFAGQAMDHAYCVYTLADGTVWRYDEYWGSHSLYTKSHDPRVLGNIVAHQLVDRAVTSRFLD